jgi:hypothetical protein
MAQRYDEYSGNPYGNTAPGGNPYGNTASNANPYGSGETYGAAANPYGGGGGVSHAWPCAPSYLADTICSTVRKLVRRLRCTRRTQTIRRSLRA